MDKLTLTLSANAGIAIQFAGHRIWVDALPGKRERGFSVLTPQLQQQMLLCEAFQAPELILFTHLHGDHYCPHLALEAQRRWPKAMLIAPSPAGTLTGQEASLELDGLTVRFLPLPHEGEVYQDVMHYGILLSAGDRHIFIGGDCAVASHAAEKALNGIHIHAAILPFPWITLSKGRAFLSRVLPSAHIVAVHLPFAEDDTFGYRRKAIQEATRLGSKTQVLCDPLKSISI